MLSIFLSDRYIKEGSLEEIEGIDKEQIVGTQKVRDVYQKKINDEIEARLNAETELQELKHSMLKVKAQAQEQLTDRDSIIKQQAAELARLKEELD